MEVIKDIKNEYINIKANGNYESDIREKESLLRVSESIARLNREPITSDTFVKAIELVDPELNDNQIKYLKKVPEME